MIPVNRPLLREEDLDAVMQSLRDGWISSAGPVVEEFESEWADYCGMPYGVAVANGTAALHLAVAALDLEPGFEVILPTLTIISCAQAIIYAGGIPVLVDSDPDTWCMAVDQVAARITRRTRAIMPVHLYGHPVYMQTLWDLAERFGLVLIEDAAEAHGAEFRGRLCGGLGDVSCFSFYANKIITTGEGGMILARSGDLVSRLRSLRNLCFEPERRFRHSSLGYNYRITSMQAAMGLHQIGRMSNLLAIKRSRAAKYSEQLRGIEGLSIPVESSWAKNVYWMYGVVVSEETGLDAEHLGRELFARGVETRPFFLGMHEQPALLKRGLFLGEDYPTAERLSRQGLYLPSGLGLTEDEIGVVAEAMREVLDG